MQCHLIYRNMSLWVACGPCLGFTEGSKQAVTVSTYIALHLCSHYYTCKYDFVTGQLFFVCQALFTRDDDTSDEEEADTEEPDVIAADELAGSKQR